MKFSLKIFFVSFLIIIVSFGVGGFLLVNTVFSNSLDDRVKAVCDNNSYITFSLCAMENSAQFIGYDQSYYDYIITNFSNQVTSSNPDTKVSIGRADEINFFGDRSFIDKIKENTRSYKIVSSEDKKYILAISMIKLRGEECYVETLTDITDIYQSRDIYCSIYRIILICVALFSSAVLVAFSLYITRPLVKLSNISRLIACGNFSQRADESTNTKEIYELAKNFNTMAQRVEDYIDELKNSAQSRDDFVADFTHELKTPLTSVIGYADMLRSYELDAEERRKCADYIYKEGKRLEALSQNLLSIIVLKNNEINTSRQSVGAILSETGSSVAFLLKKYSVRLEIEFENAFILAEPSLLKTLLYNVIDNACKASKKGQSIKIYGTADGNRYSFCVSDKGGGMPEAELDKIIRPFYMIDKSRSRSMGGAGLGLSLCYEIAKLHGSELKIKSKLGEGTSVMFSVPLADTETGGDEDEK